MSDEDTLNARLASQVIANFGEMAVSRALREQASNLRQQLRSAQSSQSSGSSGSGSNWNQQADKMRQANLTFKNRKLKEENERLKKENDYYRSLLTKPMEEIANANEIFKATYKESQQLLAAWMFMSTASKELVTDFALQLGKTKSEIAYELNGCAQSVLNNCTLHGNNAENVPMLALHLDLLKSKYLKK